MELRNLGITQVLLGFEKDGDSDVQTSGFRNCRCFLETKGIGRSSVSSD